MKYAIFLSAVLFFSSCVGTNSSPKVGADTVITIGLYQNPYMGGMGLDSCFRIIKDSVKLVDDKVVHTPDTTYYVRVLTPVLDPKDSTRKTKLKSFTGMDSVQSSFQPIKTSNMVQDFSAPFKPILVKVYHIQVDPLSDHHPH